MPQSPLAACSHGRFATSEPAPFLRSLQHRCAAQERRYPDSSERPKVCDYCVFCLGCAKMKNYSEAWSDFLSGHLPIECEMPDIPISVIVPAYNRKQLLQATLDSILAQTYPAREIVVIDDGSTDGTYDMLQERYGQSVRAIRQKNGGLNAARNRAVAEARYPWLAICDSDDLWHPEKLERQARLLSLAPDARHCCTDFVSFYEDGDRPNHFSYAPPGYWDVPRRDFGEAGFVIDVKLYYKMLDFQPVLPSAVVIHKELLEQIGGFKEEFARWHAEDFEFHLRCGAHPPFAVVPMPLVRYRRHLISRSGNDLLHHACGADLLEYALQHHDEAQLDPGRIRRAARQILIESATMAFHFEQLELFHQYMQRIENPPARLRAYQILAAIPQGVHHSLRQTYRRLRGTPLRRAEQ